MTERIYEIDQERQKWDRGTGYGDYPYPFGDADGDGDGEGFGEEGPMAANSDATNEPAEWKDGEG